MTQHESAATAGVEQRPQKPVWVWQLTTLAVWAFLLAIFFRFFDAISLILLGVLAAAALAAAVRPVMIRLPGKRWMRGVLAGALPFVIALILFTLVGWLIATPIKKQIQRWPEVRQNLDRKLADWSGLLGLDNTVSVDRVAEQLRAILFKQEMVATTAHLVTAILISLAFIFFGAIFILVEREKTLTEPVQALLPTRRRQQLCGFIDELDPKLRWWVLGTLISMSVVGVLSWIGYSLAGLELAIPMAALAAVAEIVPTVGPTFAFLVALLLAVSQGTSTIIGVVIVWMVIQGIESYVLIPYVMKKAVELPPVVTLFTVVLWGKIFGAAGLFLAIPLNLLVWSALKHFIGEPHAAEPEREEKPPPEPKEKEPQINADERG